MQNRGSPIKLNDLLITLSVVFYLPSLYSVGFLCVPGSCLEDKQMTLQRGLILLGIWTGIGGNVDTD